MKRLLIKNYIKQNYISNYAKSILKNDFINCQIYLKTTQNFLYDVSYFNLFEQLKQKQFKYYLKMPNFLVYKDNLSISDIKSILNISFLNIIYIKLNNKFFFNLNKNYLFIDNLINFYLIFYFFYLNFNIQFLQIIDIKCKN